MPKKRLVRISLSFHYYRYVSLDISLEERSPGLLLPRVILTMLIENRRDRTIVYSLALLSIKPKRRAVSIMRSFMLCIHTVVSLPIHVYTRIILNPALSQRSLHKTRAEARGKVYSQYINPSITATSAAPIPVISFPPFAGL
jgi:hypothetical protein